MQFRLEITGKERLVTYVLKIAPGTGTRVEIEREVLRYKRGSYGAPFRFLDFAHGKGYAITNEEEFSKKTKSLPAKSRSSMPRIFWRSRAWASSSASRRPAPFA